MNLLSVQQPDISQFSGKSVKYTRSSQNKTSQSRGNNINLIGIANHAMIHSHEWEMTIKVKKYCQGKWTNNTSRESRRFRWDVVNDYDDVDIFVALQFKYSKCIFVDEGMSHDSNMEWRMDGMILLGISYMCISWQQLTALIWIKLNEKRKVLTTFW